MTENEHLQQDQEVVECAVVALAAAQQRAIASGRTVVMVVNGELIQTGPSGTFVLRKLPPRKRVSTQVKKAKS